MTDAVYEIDISPILRFLGRFKYVFLSVGLILVFAVLGFFIFRPRRYTSISYISLPYMPVVSVTRSSNSLPLQYAVHPKVVVNYVNELSNTMCQVISNNGRRIKTCEIEAVLVSRNEYPVYVRITAESPDKSLALHKEVLNSLNNISGLVIYKESVLKELVNAIKRIEKAVKNNPQFKQDASLVQELTRYSTIKTAIENYNFYFVVEPRLMEHN